MLYYAFNSIECGMYRPVSIYCLLTSHIICSQVLVITCFKDLYEIYIRVMRLIDLLVQVH